MAQRKAKAKPMRGALPHLTKRNGVFYWQREHAQLGRVYRSLGTRDKDIANAYAGSLQKLMDRGDWEVLRRYVAGKLHISAIERAVREGDWGSLKRLHMSGPLLGEQADLFLASVGATRRSRTEVLRRSALKLAREHFGDLFPMHTLMKADAEKYLHQARDGGKAWSPNTQASHATSLSRLWSFAMQREREEAEKFGAEPWLRTNPWRLAERPDQEQTRFSFFTPEQARHLLTHEAVAGTPREALLTAAFDAGLRRGELANLRTGVDVDLVGGFVHVQSRGGAHAWKPKTKRGERRIPMTARLRGALERHVAAGHAGERYFFRGEHRDAPPNVHTLATWTRQAYGAAGFAYGRSGDALSLHSARHSFATWLLENGTPLTIVARLMGDTVEVILRVYAHMIPNSDRLAIDVLEKLAGNVTHNNTPSAEAR